MKTYTYIDAKIAKMQDDAVANRKMAEKAAQDTNPKAARIMSKMYISQAEEYEAEAARLTSFRSELFD